MIVGITTAVRIVVLPGDGIGPEVTEAARRVLDVAASRVGMQLDFVAELVGGDSAVDTMRYSTPEIERVAVRAFELARQRRQRLCSVDKANMLETSRLWRSVVSRVAEPYPDVACSHMLVDAFAMDLLRRPQGYDVVVTENLFGG